MNNGCRAIDRFNDAGRIISGSGGGNRNDKKNTDHTNHKVFHNPSSNSENTSLQTIIKTLIQQTAVYINKNFAPVVTFQALFLIIDTNTTLAIIFFKEFAVYHRKNDPGEQGGEGPTNTLLLAARPLSQRVFLQIIDKKK
jgi:hypothetical protein